MIEHAWSWRPVTLRTRRFLAQAPALRPPAPTPAMTSAFNVPDAIVPKEAGSGIALGLGGAAVAAASEALPEDYETLGLIAGIAIAGYGAYRLYDHFFGDPERANIAIPPQPVVDLSLVKGRILVPADGGTAELSSMWTTFYQSNRTYRISFQVVNESPADLTLPIEFAVEERKWVLPNRTTKSTHVVKLPGRREGMEAPREIVNAWQPISAVVLGGIDAEAKLVLKGPTSQQDRVLDTVKFTI